ncbi:RNA polymerase sigma factor [Candidatus Uhrbacteria bacterium]|nr:RNA polymerase sigma factor [Candidatus Uhrbacteria bacterium]
MPKHFHEKIILYRIHHGDADAFAEVYDAFSEKIYRFIYLKVPTGQDAEDLTAETFLKCWHHLHNQKSVANLQAFLYQVARNCVVDFYRKRGSAVTESLDEIEDTVVVADRTDLSLEEKMVLKGDIAKIEVALRKLKDSYREVLVLHYLNELSVGEVAKIIGKSNGATRVLLHRGLKAVKEVLRGDSGLT